ncbi:hypothetical protein GA0070607_6068 [Micromonospora coriariae]|uniref:Glyoxalase-like domain-containing protein n=1 Tax=Micromonospora coriariae TaxID=285665 RepID=A0A1C4Y135_9ACTN|nr:hypothetical protein GA0070607_6068 [Micromonospora coriariae]
MPGRWSDCRTATYGLRGSGPARLRSLVSRSRICWTGGILWAVRTVEDVPARQMSPTVVFIQVPEGKTVKNRLHLDVSPIDGSTEDEVTRLLGLGATRTDVGQGAGRSWVVMADPEGNEFCVLRTLAPQS